MDDPRLKPTFTQAGVALLVLSLCLLLPSMSWGAYLADGDPFGWLGAIMLAPPCLLLAVWQYRGTFQGVPIAARRARTTCYVVAGFFFFGFVSNVGEGVVQKERPSFTAIVAVSILLAISGVALVLGLVNRRRWKTLQSHYDDDPQLQPRRTIKLRELLVGIGLLCVAMAATAWVIRNTPPRDAEHVSRDVAPYDLPENATDVSYHRGYRGTRAYEFTTDEATFRRWAAEQLEDTAADRDGTRVEEVVGEYRIVRYRYFTSRVPEDREATIVDGLKFDWREKDHGLHAAFDRRTGRAYFYGHLH